LPVVWILLLGWLDAAGAADRDPTVVRGELRAELQAIESLLDDADSAAVRAELHRKVDRANALLGELERQSVGTAQPTPLSGPGGTPISTSAVTPTVTPTATTPPAKVYGPELPPPLPAAAPELLRCAPARLDQIASSLREARFNSEKQERLADAVKGTSFTAEQATYLMAQFDFGSDQIEAGVRLYPHISDPENWFRVYEVFTFKNDARRLREKVGR
jgi:hypothetical protein